MFFSLVLDLAAEGISIVLTCRERGFSKQAFYARRACPVSQRDWDDTHLINATYDVHANDPQFGCRFIADELEREHAIDASENRVKRPCC